MPPVRRQRSADRAAPPHAAAARCSRAPPLFRNASGLFSSVRFWRAHGVTDKDKVKGEAKAEQLGQLVNQFILRRTNKLLSDHLPPKLVCVGTRCPASQRAYLSPRLSSPRHGIRYRALTTP
jgi:hypothetical protein